MYYSLVFLSVNIKVIKKNNYFFCTVNYSYHIT